MRNVLAVEEISQIGNNACWMAVCNMIHLYYRGQRLFWEGRHDADLPGDINTVARLNGFRWINVSIDFSEIKKAIDDNQLLLADTTLTNGAGHGVLISGYDDTNGQQIHVLDPAISNGGIGRWMSYRGTGNYNTGVSSFTMDGLYYAQYDHL
ncbi:MAG: hypothetical protein HFH41_02040 [Lachnospiraceae bacterium]|nr:hypothetical protein [Lachnospiraceae bacterium]